jgi:hypothetical protein
LEVSSKILSVRATWVERLPAMLASMDVKALHEGIARAHLQPIPQCSCWSCSLCCACLRFLLIFALV